MAISKDSKTKPRKVPKPKVDKASQVEHPSDVVNKSRRKLNQKDVVTALKVVARATAEQLETGLADVDFPRILRGVFASPETAANETYVDDRQSPLTLPSLKEADIPPSKIQRARQDLEAVISSRGVPIDSLARVLRVHDTALLTHLPFIGVRTVAQFIDRKRQTVHKLAKKYGLGHQLDGELRFSIDEVLRMKLIPRVPHRPGTP